ncbi:MAG: hypothetical protein ACM31H_05110 [Nitrososphaerales archaeon]
MQNNYNIGSSSFRDKIITVKTFLEYIDIEINRRKFKLKVRFPNSDPAKLIIRGQHTKTKVDRYAFLSGEVVEQIKI